MSASCLVILLLAIVAVVPSALAHRRQLLQGIAVTAPLSLGTYATHSFMQHFADPLLLACCSQTYCPMQDNWLAADFLCIGSCLDQAAGCLKGSVSFSVQAAA